MKDSASRVNRLSETHLVGADEHPHGDPKIAPAVVMNGEGQLLDISDAFSKLVGHDREDALGLHHPFPWCPAGEASRCRKILKCISSEGVAEGKVTSVSWRCAETLEESMAGSGPICLAVLEPEVLEDASAESAGNDVMASNLESAMRLIGVELARLGESSHALSRPVSQSTREDLELLSARERDILTPFLKGRRVPSIAKLLFISPHTVRNHLQSIYRKVGVRSQSELIDKLSGLS